MKYVVAPAFLAVAGRSVSYEQELWKCGKCDVKFDKWGISGTMTFMRFTVFWPIKWQVKMFNPVT